MSDVKKRKAFFKLGMKFEKCKSRKCSKLEKEFKKDLEEYNKLKEIRCPFTKNTNFVKYNKCIDNQYKKSKYRRTYRAFEKCGKQKCPSEFIQMNNALKLL